MNSTQTPTSNNEDSGLIEIVDRKPSFIFKRRVQESRIKALKDKNNQSAENLVAAIEDLNQLTALCEEASARFQAGEFKAYEKYLGSELATIYYTLGRYQDVLLQAIDLDNFHVAQSYEAMIKNIQTYISGVKRYKTFLSTITVAMAKSASINPVEDLEKIFKIITAMSKTGNYQSYRDKYGSEITKKIESILEKERKRSTSRGLILNIENFNTAADRFSKLFTYLCDFYDLATTLSDDGMMDFSQAVLIVDIISLLLEDFASLKKSAVNVDKDEIEVEEKYPEEILTLNFILKKMKEKLTPHSKSLNIYGKPGLLLIIKNLITETSNFLKKINVTKDPKPKKEISEEERLKIAEANRKLMEGKNAVKEEEKLDTRSKIAQNYPQFNPILKDVNESDPKKVILTFESTVKDINNIKAIFSDRSVKGVKVTRLNQTKLTLEFNSNQLENTLLNNTSVKSKISAAIKLPAPQPEQPKPVVTKPQETNQDNSQEPEKSVDIKPQETNQDNSMEGDKGDKGDKESAKNDFELTEKEIDDWVTPLAKMLGLSKEDIHWMPADQTEKAHFKIILKVGKQLEFGETKLILTDSDKTDLLSRIDKYFIKHNIAKVFIEGDEISIVPLSQRPGNVSLLQEQINRKFYKDKEAATGNKGITLFQPKEETELGGDNTSATNPKEMRKQQDITNIIRFLSTVTNCDLSNKAGLLEFSNIKNGVFIFKCKMESISTNNPDEPPHETGEFFSKLAKVINTNIGEEIVTFANKKLTIDNKELNELVKKQTLIKAEFERIAKATYTPVGKLEEAPVTNKNNIEEATEKLAEKIKTVFCKISPDRASKTGFLAYLQMITSVDYAALTDDQKYAAFMPWAFIIVNTLSNIAEEKDSIDKPLLYELRNILRHGIHDVSVEEIEHIYLPFFRQLEKCFNYFTSKQITLWTDSEILNTVKREMTESSKALLDYNIKFTDGLNAYSLQITPDFVNRIESQMMSRVQQGKQLSVEEFLFFILIKGEGKNADAFYKSTYIEIGHGTSFKTLPKDLLDNVYVAYNEEVYKRIRENYTQTHIRHKM